MPDIQEVYEMVTKQKPPEPGALERQQRRQVRAARNKKIGAFIVAGVIGVVAIALILATRPVKKATIPARVPTVEQVNAAAQEVAKSFLEAYGSFNATEAVTYLTADADITGLTNGLKGVEGLSLMTSFLKAEGYKQMLDSCDASTSAFGTSVRCTFIFQALRSDGIGLGPYSGSYFDVIVRNGGIFRASEYFEISQFSPQVWEPFAKWVSTRYPQDAAVMYQDGTFTDFSLTKESIRLWGRHTREYVKHVQRTQGP